MKRPDLDKLKLEFDAAVAQKSNWYSQYAEIYKFVLPNRTAFAAILRKCCCHT